MAGRPNIGVHIKSLQQWQKSHANIFPFWAVRRKLYFIYLYSFWFLVSNLLLILFETMWITITFYMSCSNTPPSTRLSASLQCYLKIYSLVLVESYILKEKQKNGKSNGRREKKQWKRTKKNDVSKKGTRLERMIGREVQVLWAVDEAEVRAGLAGGSGE